MNKNGFSLVEVLVFVSILSIFFVFASAVTVSSLRDMKFNEHKIMATHYSEELVEWLRAEKEDDWNVFISHLGTYCFNSLNWSTSGGCTSLGLTPAIYKRQALLEPVNTDCPTSFNCQMDITIHTYWDDLGKSNDSSIKTAFFVWE